MQYFVLGANQGRKSLQALRAGETVDIERVQESRGSRNPLDLKIIARICKELYELKSRYPKRLRPRDPHGGRFEAEACIPLHQLLPYDPQMLADFDFWTWLAIVHFTALVDWRYGGESGVAALENYGIGNGAENMLYRMWLRADMGYDTSQPDPYSLARRGDQDFWRSHLFRQAYSRCRLLARALIRYQFPDGSPSVPTLKILEIRELVKRLRRLESNLVFDYLDEGDIQRVVEYESERARADLQTRSRV